MKHTPREAEFVAHHVAEHACGDRRGFVTERAHDDVRRHDGARARVERRAEGHPVARAQRRERRVDDGHADVRIFRRRTVTGHVFRHRDDAAVREAAHERDAEFGDARRIVAERTRADDRAARVEREIEHRREDDVRSDRAHLRRERGARPPRERGIVRRAEREHRGHRHVRRDARDATALLIGKAVPGILRPGPRRGCRPAAARPPSSRRCSHPSRSPGLRRARRVPTSRSIGPRGWPGRSGRVPGRWPGRRNRAGSPGASARPGSGRPAGRGCASGRRARSGDPSPPQSSRGRFGRSCRLHRYPGPAPAAYLRPLKISSRFWCVITPIRQSARRTTPSTANSAWSSLGRRPRRSSPGPAPRLVPILERRRGDFRVDRSRPMWRRSALSDLWAGGRASRPRRWPGRRRCKRPRASVSSVGGRTISSVGPPFHMARRR